MWFKRTIKLCRLGVVNIAFIGQSNETTGVNEQPSEHGYRLHHGGLSRCLPHLHQYLLF